MEIYTKKSGIKSFNRIIEKLKRKRIVIILLSIILLLGFGFGCMIYGVYLNKTGQTPRKDSPKSPRAADVDDRRARIADVRCAPVHDRLAGSGAEPPSDDSGVRSATSKQKLPAGLPAGTLPDV